MEELAKGESEGLQLLFTPVISERDWDRSEGLHWYTAAEYAVAHPKDPRPRRTACT
jgi:hypothetical protein